VTKKNTLGGRKKAWRGQKSSKRRHIRIRHIGKGKKNTTFLGGHRKKGGPAVSVGDGVGEKVEDWPQDSKKNNLSSPLKGRVSQLKEETTRGSGGQLTQTKNWGQTDTGEGAQFNHRPQRVGGMLTQLPSTNNKKNEGGKEGKRYRKRFVHTRSQSDPHQHGSAQVRTLEGSKNNPDPRKGRKSGHTVQGNGTRAATLQAQKGAGKGPGK